MLTHTVIFHIQFVGMFMIYYRTEFHVPSSDGALGTSIKQDAEENVLLIAMLLFHFPHKNDS